MKRGIVMEVKRRKAVILTENGRFQRIRFPKAKMPNVGDEVAVSPKGVMSPKIKHTKRWVPAIAAVAVIFIFAVLLSGFYKPASSQAAAYISYDVNPSFSAAVNGDLRVISVKTWNQDAADLFSNWKSYRNMKLKDFTSKVMETFSRNGYLKGQPDILIATSVVAGEQSQEKVKTSLQQTMMDLQSSNFPELNGKVWVKSSDSVTRNKANELGFSLGKYLLYKEAKDNGKNLSIDQAKKMSVSAIRQKIDRRPVTHDDKKQIEANNKNTSTHASKQRQKSHTLKPSNPERKNKHKEVSHSIHKQKAKAPAKQNHGKKQHRKPRWTSDPPVRHKEIRRKKPRHKPSVKESVHSQKRDLRHLKKHLHHKPWNKLKKSLHRKHNENKHIRLDYRKHRKQKYHRHPSKHRDKARGHHLKLRHHP